MLTPGKLCLPVCLRLTGNCAMLCLGVSVILMLCLCDMDKKLRHAPFDGGINCNALLFEIFSVR